MTHYGGCAVLVNKDTFFPDVKVKSIYFHDVRRVLLDKAMEGGSGWVLQGVLSWSSFRRQPLNGHKKLSNLRRYTSVTFTRRTRQREETHLRNSHNDV